MTIHAPDNLPPWVHPKHAAENKTLADEHAQPGTVMHFAFRLGFMPGSEASAEATIERCLRELEWFKAELEKR